MKKVKEICEENGFTKWAGEEMYSARVTMPGCQQEKMILERAKYLIERIRELGYAAKGERIDEHVIIHVS